MADVFTAATAIGWVVSPVIDLIMKKTQSYIASKLFERSGLEEDMNKMEITLLEILSIMGTVEKQKVVDQNQIKLVWKIKDAIYDAEDAIDEFEYNILEKEHEKQQNTVGWIAASTHSVYRHTVGKFIFKRIVKAVNEKLSQAKESAEKLLQIMSVNNTFNIHNDVNEPENWQLTSSIINEKIIGRENERELLINLLFEQVEGQPTIIQIIGQGGVGKTSLAQLVFNDSRLDGHFDQKIWLTISDNFDKLKLTKEILKYVCESFSSVDVSFDMLQQKLVSELVSKRILLMLDDVWYDKDDNFEYINDKEWLEFLAPLKNAKIGSKIILTTRQGLVRSSLGSLRSIALDGLNEDDSWSLFEFCAFDGDNLHKRQVLEPIGKMIVHKLRGLALAIRVVGTQLRGNSDVEEWKRTLNDNPLDTSDILKILHRSYEHLPKHLKRCFAYCSLFPKDYHLNPDQAVHMWIAQGFVHSEEKNNLEYVGKFYFKELLDRSFFQVIKRGEKKYYVMHDLMNDLASHISKGECYLLDKGDSISNLGSIRHLSVTHRAIDILKNINGLEKLRTLMLVTSGRVLDKNLIEEEVSKLKKIRVLHIEWELECLPNISECKHLRYLSYVVPYYIPDFFDKLHHLSVLFVTSRGSMKACDYSVLPKSMCNLSSLVLLDTNIWLTVNADSLVKFQSLWRGPASLHIEKGRHGLDLLEHMNNIKGSLMIWGLENAACREEASKAQLCRKEHVTELELDWGSCSEMDSSKCEEVLEALSPNPNLEWLKINNYPGGMWPSWFESNVLSTTRSIFLSQCKGIKKLPSLGQLPSLQKLRMKELTAVRKIGHEFYGNGRFPSLESLEISDFVSLEKWSYPCNVPVFPKLNKLEITDCPMLMLNGFPAPQYLKIWCPGYYMKKRALFQRDVSYFKGLTALEIVCCKGLVTLKGLRELISLRRFIIKDCQDLLLLPEMEFFYSLEFLAILDCPELRSLPRKGLPVSLQLLWIGGVLHHALKRQIRGKKGHDWDKISAISGCDLYSTIDNRKNSGAWHFFRSESSIEDFVSGKLQEFKVNKAVYIPHSA